MLRASVYHACARVLWFLVGPARFGGPGADGPDRQVAWPRGQQVGIQYPRMGCGTQIRGGILAVVKRMIEAVGG